MTSQLLTRFPKIPHFLAVARLDKPIGIYLLLWPTLWGLWIAAEGFPGWHLLAVFVLGTILTRSAGCIINDVADREFDRLVKRTRGRPLATGALQVEEALIFLGVLLFAALLLVLTTNWLTVLLALCAALVAGLYPLMKRYTYLPQVVLGIAFSFGIPMGFAATTEDIPQYVWLMVVANIIWTVAYDTEYAMVDRDDDLKIGVKSTAILFADMDKLIIAVLQTLFIVILLLLHRHIELGWPFNLGLVVACALLAYQQYLIKDRSREQCLAAFQNNHWVGLAIFLGILGHYGF
ncbi:MAG: 4-hydroxybenzoate octaprenyltransferase [Pseudomonadales bacterium]